MKNILSLFVFISILTIFSCGDNGDGGNGETVDDFDRKVMLIDIADGIIIPAFEDHLLKVESLNSFAQSFVLEPTVDDLILLRDHWLEAYKTWQYVSMFNIGKAEENGLRNFSNIYPTNASEIEENITSGSYNLELPSKNDEQGFPALDYLLFGMAQDDASIILKLSDSKYADYLIALTARIEQLTSEVVIDWKENFRETFVNDNGATATSSVNKIVNDYLFYYEKFLRAGKIGIPAGVFSGDPLADRVEAYYAQDVSKDLFLTGLEASQRFFNGISYDTDATGAGLKSYLDYLNTIKEGADLSTLINNQFDISRNKANELNANLAFQVESDNIKMLETYDELQKNVILLKVDMLQALNIKVDFVDADGD